MTPKPPKLTYEGVRDKADEIAQAYLHGSGIDAFAKEMKEWLKLFSKLARQNEREYRTERDKEMSARLARLSGDELVEVIRGMGKSESDAKMEEKII